jgi:peroxiredoxin
MNKLQINDLAPAFKLEDADGKAYTLEQFRGKKVVLYFYPKDDTPGCTTEACTFRDDGKITIGLIRKTFLINEEGKIIKIYPRVRVNGHSEAILKEFGIEK